MQVASKLIVNITYKVSGTASFWPLKISSQFEFQKEIENLRVRTSMFEVGKSIGNRCIVWISFVFLLSNDLKVIGA